MISQIKESPLTENFVAPYICKHLIEAGLSPNVPFQWKIGNGLAELFTYAFDPDGFYKDGDQVINLLNPAQAILPAYNIKNIEKILPSGYLLTHNEIGLYEVSLMNIYHGEGCAADRMPDAFAKLLLHAIFKRLVDLKKINTILQHEKCN